MVLRTGRMLTLLLLMLTAVQVAAADDARIALLRDQVAALRQEFDKRLAGLQAAIDAAQPAPARDADAINASPSSPSPSSPSPSSPSFSSPSFSSPSFSNEAAITSTVGGGSVAVESRATETAAVSSGGTAFNPNIGLNLQGRYGAFTRTPGARALPGFQLGSENGAGAKGLSLGESELSLSANIDDHFYGFANLAFVQDNGESAVDVEEVYLQSTALPYGLTVRAGQFFSAIGYQNSRHSHAWDFVDQPLAYEALLNGQYLDPGVRLSWLAPSDLFAEFGVETFRGDRFPGGGAARDGVGTTTVYGNFGGDLSDASAWQAGLSWLAAHPRQRHYEAANGEVTEFTGSSDLLIADVVWKWSPDGNFHDRNLTVQAEWLHRSERGKLALLSGESAGSGRYHGTQDGWYVQTVYQFAPRWRAGLRYDELASSNRTSGLAVPTILDGDGGSPRRYSAMLDFSNSEFSRFRLQYNRDETNARTADQLYLQYIMSLGAHGAHAF